MTTDFVDTPTNMVQVVKNAIESYGMGSIRALAQEPVQNSKDAKHHKRVHVEYELHTRRSQEGISPYLLTITDCGTTGLQGRVLSVEERENRGNELKADENWAAFEGQGFTRKKGQDALGSRGQGKSAFLYHSRPTNSNGDQSDRYLILYDTLLKKKKDLKEEYRLGIRYAMPADKVRQPPLYDDEAIQTIRGDYDTGDGIVVPLKLDPLVEQGTRVIIPYLSDEALKAIHKRELHRWLQRCWWRAIQIGTLEITVVDDQGRSELIQVPQWWKSEPWKNGDDRVKIQENIPIEDGLKIKRIVLLYDETLSEDEIEGYDPQYKGVQLLRSQQWIETLDVSDFIPKEQLGGFRGFVEFDLSLERELKKTEKPQHENFDGRNSLVRKVRDKVKDAVRSFAEERGWHSEAETRHAPELEREFATEFLRVFASGVGATRQKRGNGSVELDNDATLNWDCELQLDFPTAKSSRVNWGQSINNVIVSVQCEPVQPSRWIDVSLELTREGDSSPSKIDQRKGVQVQEGIAKIEFGDFQIVQGRAGTGKIQFPEPGEWKLRAKIRYSGEEVKSAMRRLYVEMDPPDSPQPKPQMISVSVKNLSRQGERRINNGDEIGVQVTVTNRAVDGVTLRVDASLEQLLLADAKEVTLDGVPIGDVPNRQTAVSKNLHVYTSPPLIGSEPHIVLQPGRYYLRADLWTPDEKEPIAHASQPIYVEVDPGGNQSGLPFELEAVEGEGPHPMWQLQERSVDNWVLRYPNQYPLYRNLSQPQRQRSKLAGSSSFIAEVCANGLLDWALTALDTHNSTRVDQLLQSRPNGISFDRWESYCEQLDRLVGLYNKDRIYQFSEYMKRWRECVAYMLMIFEDFD